MKPLTQEQFNQWRSSGHKTVPWGSIDALLKEHAQSFTRDEVREIVRSVLSDSTSDANDLEFQIDEIIDREGE